MRKLMWFSIGFAIACAVGAYFYVPWLLFAAIGAALLAGLMFVAMRFAKVLRIGVAVLLGIAMGFGWFFAYDRIHLASARDVHEKTESVTISVKDYSYQTSYGCGFDGEVTLGNSTYRVRAYLNQMVELKPGDSVSGGFSFRLTTNGTDDSPTYHQGKGIFLIAYQKGDTEVISSERIHWTDYPAVWRQKIVTIIDSAFPADTVGFAKALLLGDRTDIDYATNTAFKLSGISHIIAVSGLHVSILFGFIYTLAGKRRLLTALLGIPGVILFAAVAGFSPSVTRAGIMQILMMIALLFDKEYDPPTALSFAALVMLIGNPLVITSVSFQLSIGCMAGIFLFSERIRGWLLNKKRLGKHKGRFTGWLASSVSITLSAMVFTTPLVAVYFGAVSLIGILTNLCTLWVVTYIFYGILLVCAVGSFSMSIAGVLGWIVAWLIRYVLAVSKLLSQVPLAAVYTKSVYVVIWLVFCYVLFGAYLFLKKKPALPFCCAAVIGLCLCLGLSWAEPMLDECRVTALDVGQGQCILLQSKGKTFLVDCGGSYDEDTADIASETLLSQGISRVNGIILTHYDKDHVGGAEYLLTRIKADALYLPFTQDDDKIGEKLTQLQEESVISVSEDLELSFEDTTITIFAPLSYKSGNESSMCVLFQTENCDILITGDRPEQGENILLERHDIPKLELLIAGHHGAKTSTGEALLAATMPEYVIISAGKDNPYGHPSAEVLSRLIKYNCKILRTDQMGTIFYRR